MSCKQTSQQMEKLVQQSFWSQITQHQIFKVKQSSLRIAPAFLSSRRLFRILAGPLQSKRTIRTLASTTHQISKNIGGLTGFRHQHVLQRDTTQLGRGAETLETLWSLAVFITLWTDTSKVSYEFKINHTLCMGGISCSESGMRSEGCDG